jgi:S1-C subfamily serine protease
VTVTAAAGLLVGDILVGIESQRTQDADDLLEALTPARIGLAVGLQLLRGGAEREVVATLAERS